MSTVLRSVSGAVLVYWQQGRRIYKPGFLHCRAHACLPQYLAHTSPHTWPSCICLQRFLTSTMQNLSTQSMLLALGLGAKSSVAASAAINWLLKDGVGRIARMTVATQFCQSFDSDLKV